MPLCMVISWVYSVAMTIQHIVAEKEHRLKEVGLGGCRHSLPAGCVCVVWGGSGEQCHPFSSAPAPRALICCPPQVMKTMGLNNAVHWVAWFITGFVQLSISVTALTAILKYGQVLMHSHVLIIWLFLAVYAVATIMFW